MELVLLVVLVVIGLIAIGYLLTLDHRTAEQHRRDTDQFWTEAQRRERQ